MRNDPLRPIPKPVRHVEKSYRDWIKSLPCYAGEVMFPIKECNGPIDPHHVIPKGEGRVGSKVSDRRCVPLCRSHHDIAEQSQRLFNAIYGDPEVQIKRYVADYNLQRRKVPKPRLKGATLKIVGICSKGHSTKIPIKKFNDEQFYCVQCRKVEEVG